MNKKVLAIVAAAAVVVAGGAYLLLRWSTSSPSKHFSLKRLKKFQYQGKIDYIWDKQHGQHNDYQSQRIN